MAEEAIDYYLSDEADLLQLLCRCSDDRLVKAMIGSALL